MPPKTRATSSKVAATTEKKAAAAAKKQAVASRAAQAEALVKATLAPVAPVGTSVAPSTAMKQLIASKRILLFPLPLYFHCLEFDNSFPNSIFRVIRASLIWKFGI